MGLCDQVPPRAARRGGRAGGDEPAPPGHAGRASGLRAALFRGGRHAGRLLRGHGAAPEHDGGAGEAPLRGGARGGLRAGGGQPGATVTESARAMAVTIQVRSRRECAEIVSLLAGN